MNATPIVMGLPSMHNFELACHFAEGLPARTVKECEVEDANGGNNKLPDTHDHKISNSGGGNAEYEDEVEDEGRNQQDDAVQEDATEAPEDRRPFRFARHGFAGLQTLEKNSLSPPRTCAGR